MNTPRCLSFIFTVVLTIITGTVTCGAKGGPASPPAPQPSADPVPVVTYPVVDTGQTKCYNASAEITAPGPGQSFYGQDA